MMYRSKRKTRPTRPLTACGPTLREKESERLSPSERRKEAKPTVRAKVMTNATAHSHHSLRSIRWKLLRDTSAGATAISLVLLLVPRRLIRFNRIERSDGCWKAFNLARST